MVKGLDRFRDYFRDFTDQYILIGGAACDISFEIIMQIFEQQGTLILF